MPQIDVIDTATPAIKQFVDSLTNEVLIKAVVRAVNRTAKRGQTVASKLIRGRYNIQAKQLSRAFRIQNATFSNRDATIFVRGRNIPLVLFKPQQKIVDTRLGRRRGVTVEVIKGKRSLVNRGFIAAMPSGKVGIFKRKRKQTKRLPIVELFSSAIPTMFSQPVVQQPLIREMETAFLKNFEADFQFFSKKALK